MIDSESLRAVKEAVQRRTDADGVLLDRLRAETRVPAHGVREIRSRCDLDPDLHAMAAERAGRMGL